MWRAAGVSPSSLSARLCSAEVNRSGHLSLHQFPCLEHRTGLLRPELSAGMIELDHQFIQSPGHNCLTQATSCPTQATSCPPCLVACLFLWLYPYLKLSYSYPDLAQSHQ